MCSHGKELHQYCRTCDINYRKENIAMFEQKLLSMKKDLKEIELDTEISDENHLFATLDNPQRDAWLCFAYGWSGNSR